MKSKNNQFKTRTLKELTGRSLKSGVCKNAYNEELMKLKFAVEIKNLRTQKKLTQEAFAIKTNMPQSVIARIESGKYNISLNTLNRVAEALGKQVQLG